MGLRGRLVLFFVVITVVPLLVAGALLQRQIDVQLEESVVSELHRVATSATALVERRRQRARDLATDLPLRAEAGDVLQTAQAVQVQRWLDSQPDVALQNRADVVVVVGRDGEPLASRIMRDPPQDVPADDVAERIAVAMQPDRPAPPSVLLEAVEVRGDDDDASSDPLGTVVAGLWLDTALLADVSPSLAKGEGAAFITGDTVVAIVGAQRTAVPTDMRAAGPAQRTTIGGEPVLAEVVALPVGGTEGPARQLLVWAPAPQHLGLSSTLAVVALGVAAAAWLGWLLAGGVIAPVRQAADVARAVAAGDLSRKLTPTGGRELADLAVALNAMSDELSARLGEVERSRDELRKTLSRLGSTLSSTLDLGATLSVVVDSAMDTLRAERAVLMLLTPERDALYTKVGRGVGSPRRLGRHEGIAGHVVRADTPMLLPGDDDAPAPAPGEPTAAHQVSVPLHAGGSVVGVLTLLRDASGPFVADDVDTIRSFAAQTSVAIENVMLHRQAQRESFTDPMTGLWNFRYFRMQAERELNSAERFDRPLSLLIVDLDYFKDVNDSYGHPAGDAALVEISRRLRDATRTPDIVTRYGGEEFAVLLPDTDYEGALSSAERVRRAVADEPITLPAASTARNDPVVVSMTCSVGVSTFPVHGRDEATMRAAADAAMYTAKRQGRNCVVGADDVREAHAG